MSVCSRACYDAALGLHGIRVLRGNHSDWKEEAAFRERGHQSSRRAQGLARPVKTAIPCSWVGLLLYGDTMKTTHVLWDTTQTANFWPSIGPLYTFASRVWRPVSLTARSATVEERMASVDVFSRPHCLWGFYPLVSGLFFPGFINAPFIPYLVHWVHFVIFVCFLEPW